MDNRTFKVFVACALGAGIGTLVALEINHYFWWVGLLVGGITGYLSHEFRMVLRAIPVAWEKANGISFDGMRLAEGLVVFFYFLAAFSAIAAILALIIHGMIFDEFPNAERINNYLNVYFWVMTVFSFIGLFFAKGHLGQSPEERAKDLAEARQMALGMNIIVFPIFAVCAIVVLCCVAVWEAMTSSPKAAVRFYKFCVAFFRLIHSEERLLCGVDAAIGAAVGYFFGSAIIGAVAGGAFGALNYEIFSKHVLKLVPMNS